MKTEELQALVIESLVVRNTLDGAFQRANIYKKSGDITATPKNNSETTFDRILMISDYIYNYHDEIIRKFYEYVSEKQMHVREGGSLKKVMLIAIFLFKRN